MSSEKSHLLTIPPSYITCSYGLTISLIVMRFASCFPVPAQLFHIDEGHEDQLNHVLSCRENFENCRVGSGEHTKLSVMKFCNRCIRRVIQEKLAIKRVNTVRALWYGKATSLECIFNFQMYSFPS